jgi:hypothetical protein
MAQRPLLADSIRLTSWCYVPKAVAYGFTLRNLL